MGVIQTSRRYYWIPANPLSAIAFCSVRVDFSLQTFNIRLAGTKSLMTGKAYQVRMKDGKTVLTQRWLEDALEKYRTKGGHP